jgi:NADH:ubiquinone oxidoreductase subunit C
VGELFGVDFIGKSDIRNLLLQYGMTDHPMQKFFPVIGTSEVVYYQLIDAVIKIPLALQY